MSNTVDMATKESHHWKSLDIYIITANFGAQISEAATQMCS